MAGLDAELREQLATNWLRAAQLEHASIAAFGRFLLELLAFGAPAELVSLTIQAMDDERRHAELCFALASEYAGVPLGPAELDLEGPCPPSPWSVHSSRRSAIGVSERPSPLQKQRSSVSACPTPSCAPR